MTNCVGFEPKWMDEKCSSLHKVFLHFVYLSESEFHNCSATHCTTTLLLLLVTVLPLLLGCN